MNRVVFPLKFIYRTKIWISYNFHMSQNVNLLLISFPQSLKNVKTIFKLVGHMATINWVLLGVCSFLIAGVGSQKHEEAGLAWQMCYIQHSEWLIPEWIIELSLAEARVDISWLLVTWQYIVLSVSAISLISKCIYVWIIYFLKNFTVDCKEENMLSHPLSILCCIFSLFRSM